MPFVVKGMADLQRALKYADRDVRLGVRREMRETAEPVRRDAQTLAGIRIRRIGSSWDDMRTGVTQRSVYVAPRQRGVRRGDHPLSRPNLARLLMDRAMRPALERNEPQVRQAFDRMLGDMARRFNRG